jgi:glutathione S-transferase
MKLYYSPGACSIGIHVLLEEIGKPYELERADLTVPPPDRPLTKVNVKSKVPTLIRDDGSLLTEFGAIATWLARMNPTEDLLPADPEDEARAIEAMDFAIGTVHTMGFARLFRPSRFTANEADHEAVKAQGRAIIEAGYAWLEHALDGKPYIAGDFSIADAAVFYVEFWGAARMNMTLPTHLAGHYARMKARPAVAAVLKQEGFA